MFLNPNDYSCPQELIEASQRFRQGDILKDVAVGFSAPGKDAMTSQARDETAGEEPCGVLRVIPFAIILTQTCDLQHSKKIQAIPLINVAPVYNGFDVISAEQAYLLNKPKPFAHMIKLSSSELRNEADTTCWVADLRFDMPIDRGFLLGREPIKGFASEDDYQEASKQIAAYRGRAAVDDNVIKHVLKPLGKLIKDAALGGKVLEVWLKCYPTYLHVTRVRVYLLVEQSDRDEVEDVVAQWYTDEFMPSFLPRGLGIAALQPAVELLNGFGRAKERGKIQITDFDGLSAEEQR